jgi:signal peptidase I
VVGVPGDTIAMRNGHVIRNGVAELDSKYTEPCGNGPSRTFPAPVKVPAGDYFTLGDNRGVSNDSRFWGPVPIAWIIGKAAR